MTLADTAKRLECFETPDWCVEKILEQCRLGPFVWDACCGPGIMAKIAKRRGHKVYATDIYDWGYGNKRSLDFLQAGPNDVPFDISQTTLFINPPFSKATEFVEHGWAIGVNYMVVFQRLAWLESQKRREFWDLYSPTDIYLCGTRASCWLHTIPLHKRGSSSTTAHAWFVFTNRTRRAPRMNRIYK